jgi:hypothetical protein
MSEQPTGRIGAPLAADQDFDGAALVPTAAARTEHNANPVPGGGKGEVDRCTAPSRDAITGGADSLYLELDRLSRQCRDPATAPTDARLGGLGNLDAADAYNPLSEGDRRGDPMYRWVYWSGVIVFFAWTALSAYRALNGL